MTKKTRYWGIQTNNIRYPTPRENQGKEDEGKGKKDKSGYNKANHSTDTGVWIREREEDEAKISEVLLVFVNMGSNCMIHNHRH